MSNREIVKELLRQIYQTDDFADMKKLTGAAIAILDVPDPDNKPVTSKAPAVMAKSSNSAASGKPEKKKGRPAFDIGKMNALLKANWSIPKIADEMGVSEPTVRKYMKQEGYK